MLASVSCEKKNPAEQKQEPEGETGFASGYAEVKPEAGIPGNKVKWVQLWKKGPQWAVINVGNDTGYRSYGCGGYYAWKGIKSRDCCYRTVDDTAEALWGPFWRMPTSSDFIALLDNCDAVWTNNYNNTGKAGRVFTGRGEYKDNSVFFPAAGECFNQGVFNEGYRGLYWSSTNNGARDAYKLSFHEGEQSVPDDNCQNQFSVRAVLADNGMSVTDACDNTYSVTKIGNQYWMAENLRCDKYDKQSEAYKEGRLTVPTSDKEVLTPYYTNAADTSKWDDSSKDRIVNLTKVQIKKIGYLYNWAATVGIADGGNQTKDFTSRRQGICPDGWHVPSKAEWQTLVDYIEKTDEKGEETAGKHLKTTSGWANNYNGVDTYGFGALPAGVASGKEVTVIGVFTYFWTSNIDEGFAGSAFTYFTPPRTDELFCNSFKKENARSVRCLKN